jgi:hypothetical protein
MDLLWGAVDVERWQETPCLRGRVAAEQDVKSGRAVFYLNAEEIGAVYVDIGLPHCAILTAGGQSTPVIVIQSERAGEKHYIGYRTVSGGNGICLLFEVQLLEKPDERFYRYA